MKTTPEPTDRVPVLGLAIRDHKPAPAPTPVAPGIERDADGRLRTTSEPAPMPVVYWGVGLFVHAE